MRVEQLNQKYFKFKIGDFCAFATKQIGEVI
jgi:hypothetical protein